MNKQSHLVVYSDPQWALGADGQIDPGRASLERDALGPDVNIRLGVRHGGRFVPSGELLEEALAGADALVIYRTEITPRLVEILKGRCKVVARQGVGIDNLNAPLLQAANIWAFNVPDYCVDEVVAHTLGMAFAIERGIVVQDRLLKAGRWDIFAGGRPRRLANLTLGIIGMGRIGRSLSAKARPFYSRVVAFDPYVHGDLMTGYGARHVATLRELLEQSDVVSLHPALTPETRHIINNLTIRFIKDGAVLINNARGALVEPEAVLAALRDGRLRGYGSDVFSPENPHDTPANREILSFENVVVTSHRAFLSDEAERSQRLRVAEGVLEVLQHGRPPTFGRVA